MGLFNAYQKYLWGLPLLCLFGCGNLFLQSRTTPLKANSASELPEVAQRYLPQEQTFPRASGDTCSASVGASLIRSYENERTPDYSDFDVLLKTHFEHCDFQPAEIESTDYFLSTVNGPIPLKTISKGWKDAPSAVVENFPAFCVWHKRNQTQIQIYSETKLKNGTTLKSLIYLWDVTPSNSAHCLIRPEDYIYTGIY